MEFVPPFGLRNKHLQTILSSVGPRRLLLNRIKSRLATNSKSEIIDAGESVRLLSFYDVAKAGVKSDQLMILIHGWEGSDTSSYMLSATQRLLAEGVDVVRLNLRDHGESHHLNQGLFNSTLIRETATAVANIVSEKNYQS